MLKRLLAHPLTRGLDIDAPGTTLLRRRIIRGKPFLKRIYLEWYASLASALPPGRSGPVLELGSGGGFLQDVLPGVLASEMFYLPGIRLVLDGLAIPFRSASLRGILMTNVFHHIPRPEIFLREASRCLQPGGVLAMIEPWVTPWSRQVYQKLHHEPFQPEMPGWEFPSTGPVSGANGALPWIVLQRDRLRFEELFPDLAIQSISPCMPLVYLLSGGVSLRSLAPGWSYSMWRSLEKMLHPRIHQLAMFACIILCKRPRSW